VWKDVFANSGDQTLDLYFKDLGEYFSVFTIVETTAGNAFLPHCFAATGI
jgi:hypothetical protein